MTHDQPNEVNLNLGPTGGSNADQYTRAFDHSA